MAGPRLPSVRSSQLPAPPSSALHHKEPAGF